MYSGDGTASLRLPFASVVRRSLLLSAIVVGALVIGVFVSGAPVYALTNVNANVRDSQPASLTVNGSGQSITTSSSSFTIEGIVHNVGQIMIYVDGQHHSTLPLDFGATTFSVTLLLGPGEHAVRLVGIDPVMSSQVEDVLRVTYDPSLPPSTSGGSSTSSSDGATPAYKQGLGGAVIDSSQTVNERAETLSQQGLFKPVLDGLFGFMVAADLVVPGQESQMGHMIGRLVLILVGLVLTMFPWGVYTMMRRLPFVPAVNEPTSKIHMPIRLLGVLLLILPFVVFP